MKKTTEQIVTPENLKKAFPDVYASIVKIGELKASSTAVTSSIPTTKPTAVVTPPSKTASAIMPTPHAPQKKQDPPPTPSPVLSEDTLRDRWNKSPDIRKEFGKFDVFFAFEKHQRETRDKMEGELFRKTASLPAPEMEESKLQAEWNGDRTLRKEFGQSFETYLAYVRAKEKKMVKVYGVTHVE